MSAATQEPIRLVSAAPPRPGRASGQRLYVGIVAVVGIAILVAIGSSISSRGHGVRGLPQDQRAALLSRTVDELRQFCGEGRADALKDHCRELASFAAQFDECRGECETLVRPLLTPTPTR